MGIIDEFLDKVGLKVSEFFSSILDPWTSWFNPDFLQLVGYTAMAVGGAFVLGWAFAPLRPFAGAVMMSVAAMWYGFHKGQNTMQKKKKRK